MNIKQFKIIKKIGQGSFSEVFLGQRLEDQELYAIKKIKIRLLSKKEQQNALNEIRFLASIKNKNIIKYKDSFIDDIQQNIYIILEYAQNGDIQGQINQHKKQNTNFDENDIWLCLIHALNGLNCLHQNKICHRDIKSGNIFISVDQNQKNEYKLGDFNVSKLSKNDIMTTQTGTPYYCAPEIWKNEIYDFKSDIWSLGAVIYEMASLKPPFQAKNMEQLKRKICQGQYDKIPDIYSSELQQVIKDCLKQNSHQRPSSKQLLISNKIQQKIDQFRISKQQDSINLMKTIKMTPSLLQLQQKLPKSNYDIPQENVKQLTHQKNNSMHNLHLINLKEKSLIQQLSPNILQNKNMVKQNVINIFKIQEQNELQKLQQDTIQQKIQNFLYV